MNRLKTVVFLGLAMLLSIGPLSASRHKIDSLRKELYKSHHDSMHCRILISIGKLYEQSSKDSALFFYGKSLEVSKNKGFGLIEAESHRQVSIVQYELGNDSIAMEHFAKSMEIFQKLGNKSEMAKNVTELASAYKKKGENEKAVEYFQKGLAMYEELADKNSIAMVLNNLGMTWRVLGDYTLAIDCYNKSIAIKEELGDKRGVANGYGNLGVIYRNQGHDDKAIENYLLALKVFEELSDKDRVSKCYNNIGNIYFNSNNYDKALENYTLSLEMCEDLGDKNGIARACNNIGKIYHIEKKTKQALEYLSKSVKLSQEAGDKETMAFSHSNIGYIYKEQGNHELAQVEFQKSLKLREEIKDKRGMGNSYLALSELFIELLSKSPEEEKEKHFSAVLFYAQKAYKTGVEMKLLSTQKSAAGKLQQAYEIAGKFEEALRWAKISLTTTDSLYNEEKTKVVAEMQTKFETSKKQQEIDKQQLIIEKQEFENQKRLAERNYLALILLFILLVAGGSVYGTITIRKKNMRLSQSEKELKDLIKTKDRLFSIIAHDLKSPFTSLVGLTHLMAIKSQKMETEKVVKYSNLIHLMSQTLLELIENLLHWSRSQTGSLAMIPKEIQVQEMVSDIMSLMATQAENKNISLIQDIEAGVNVYADYETVSTVLRNLVSNAIKFTPEHGEVFVMAMKRDSKTIIKITDNGVGISPENMKKMFQSGQTFTTKGTNQESGTGLGLLICKEFVERNGGTISVESQPEKGTCFIIILPGSNTMQPSNTVNSESK
jgi:signal transduction histidine kinase/Tfp pilus assembly protein PilF